MVKSYQKRQGSRSVSIEEFEEMKRKALAKTPLQSLTKPKEVDCYIASEEKSCITCKHRRWIYDGMGGFQVYCEHPQNTRETNYKCAAECRERYTHWEPDGNSDETNQSIKADAGKPQLTLVPRQILFDIASVREYGTKKYGGTENWKQVDKQRYRDAAFRHFMAYLDDPDGTNAESGLSHLAHLACNIAFLCELEKKDG